MDAYAGFEPEVGEIRALRSFRIGAGGVLYPLFHKQPWTDGTNSAQCHARDLDGAPAALPPPHQPPEPGCACGFYAYASEPGEAESPFARNVLASVACWGRVIAGTRGIRAEHSRIEALWLSDRVPADLAVMVADRYPSVQIYRDKDAMVRDYPPTRLDCYDRVDVRPPLASRRALGILIVLAVLAASVPITWVSSAQRPFLLGVVALLWLLVGVVTLSRPVRSADGKRLALLALAVALWMAAPLADRTGVLLLRLPLLQIGCLLYIQRRMLHRAASQFPATIG